MQITNNAHLPDAIVRAVVNDPYPTRGTGDISVTRLIGPPQIRILERRHRDELTEDASDRIWALVGQVAHGILERAESVAITEERLFAELEGWTISGQFDRLALLPDGRLQDYKVTSVWACIDGPKPEWTAQLNALRWLAAINDYPGIDRLEIVAILRDWSRGKAKAGGNYPPQQVRVLPVPLWSLAQTRDYLIDRVHLHQLAETCARTGRALPACTDAERWAQAHHLGRAQTGPRQRLARLRQRSGRRRPGRPHPGRDRGDPARRIGALRRLLRRVRLLPAVGRPAAGPAPAGGGRVNDWLEGLVQHIRDGGDAAQLGVLSTGERCFVALAADRYDLLPPAYDRPDRGLVSARFGLAPGRVQLARLAQPLCRGRVMTAPGARFANATQEDRPMSARPTHDLVIKVGEYNDRETGETKARWLTIGTVFRHDEGGTSIKLDCLPVGLPEWNGWVSVFPRGDAAQQRRQPPAAPSDSPHRPEHSRSPGSNRTSAMTSHSDQVALTDWGAKTCAALVALIAEAERANGPASAPDLRLWRRHTKPSGQRPTWRAQCQAIPSGVCTKLDEL